MDTRVSLKFIMAGLAFGGLITGAYPFLSSMGVSAKARNNDLAVLELPPLIVGEPIRVKVRGQDLILLKPSEEQKRSINELSEHVWFPTTESYRKAVDAYVYWAQSTKWGCPLEHKPPQPSRLKEWSQSAEWLGGYWDWQCEVSYDYAGRSIKNYLYTFNGYNADFPNLETPSTFKGVHGKYVVSIRQR